MVIIDTLSIATLEFLSMTTGIVSGIGRSLPTSAGGFNIPNAIQTDAPVNPGNSGFELRLNHYND